MPAIDILGDPVRRRILELLADGEQSAGAITAVVGAEFGISQPAISQHLRVLRENGFATVRPDGARRLYSVDPTPLREMDAWLDPFRQFRANAPRAEPSRPGRHPPWGPSQTTPAGALSGRHPRHRGWRRRPSGVTSA